MERVLIKDKKREETLWDIVLMILIIFVTDSPLFFLTVDGKVTLFRTLFTCGLPILILFNMFTLKKFSIGVEKVLLFLLLSISAVITLTISYESLNAYILMISRLLTAILLSNLWSFEKFVNIFLRVLRIIATISLIGYIMCQINPDIIDLLPKITILTADRSDTTTYATLFFYNVPKEFGETPWIRNFGAFWEPGAFAAYLNIGLYFIFFQKKKYKFRALDVCLFIATLVTTTSLGGISGAVVLLLTYVIAPRVSEKQSKLKILVVLLAIVAALYISGNEDFMYLFGDRINPEGAYNGSTDSRWHSIMGNISIFFDYPIFGAGIQTVDSCLEEYYYSVGGLGRVIHNTNTMLIYFSSLGIFYGSFFFCLYCKIAARSIRGLFYKIVLFICFFLMLANEDFTGSMFFTIIPAFALTQDAFKNDFNESDDEDYEESVMDMQLSPSGDKQGDGYSDYS